MVKQRKYNVDVVKILPQNYFLENLKGVSAHLVISLSNPNHYGQRLEAILRFLDATFDHVLIMTSGFLYRYNFMILNEGCYSEALKEALQEENKFIYDELWPHRAIWDVEKFSVMRWSDYLNDKNLLSATEAVKGLFEIDTFFRKEILDTARYFLEESRYLKARGNYECSEKNINYSSNFILDELGMFNFLAQMGYRACVYPGPFLRSLDDIIQGQYPFAPLPLKSMIHLELKLSRCGRKPKNPEVTSQKEAVLIS